MIPLPIDAVLPDFVAALRSARGVVLEAPPGAGKTTRAPGALLDAGLVGDREVVVLEPRRLAARLAARRVAEERGERLGETVGYQVRFEEVASARTRIRFVTEGVLTRRLLSDPTLARVGAVLLDEFHERHLQGDVALAMLRRMQRTTRPDLCLAVMSATLDPGPIARFLGDASRVRSEGRRFEVTIEHLPQPDERPLHVLVVDALRRLVREGLDGDVLVFLPGAAEIRRCMAACEHVASSADMMVLPLHGDLSPAEQDRAVNPAPKRKVILSTNVAETSVTIDGVVAVIDSGLARIASHAPWSGLPVLRVGRVSRASAAQRAGRAGRTRPGRCLRLYTRHDHDTRPEHDAPEVRRLDLAETALELHAAGVRDLARFEWFEAPAAPSLDAAESLLRMLDAVDEAGALTERGRRMVRLPLHPRVSRMLDEAVARGVGEPACAMAAILGERDIVAARRGAGLSRDAGRAMPPRDERGDSDVTAALARFEEARRAEFDAMTVRDLGLDLGAVHAVERVRKQLARTLGRDRAERALVSPGDPDEALRVALLAAYPDRVARRLRGNEFTLVGGGTATLAETSEVRDAEFVVAVDAEERVDGRAKGVVVRMASAVEPEWLLELFPEAIREVVEARWNAEAERADVVQRLMYRALVLDETRSPRSVAADRAASELLFEKAVARGVRSFAGADPDALDRWLARASFVARHAPEAKMPEPTEADAVEALRAMCEGCRSFDDLRGASVLDALRERLDVAQRRAMEAHAPERVTLPGGRSVRVNYEPSKPPWIESRLQDFFGMAQGPAVAMGRVPLVLHLLAPNHRAVQVTTDLAGFWARHYPAIRKELCRKYPRHAWPEDGRTASPPEPRRR